MSEAAWQGGAEEGRAMLLTAKRSGALALRLMVGLALLGWPRVGAAQGTWSVISLPQKPGEVVSPSALAADATGNLYVANWYNNRIQKRDAQGNWSVVAPQAAVALAVDTAGNLYVADWADPSGIAISGVIGRIQKRDAQGNWSSIAFDGLGLGQVDWPRALAADTVGNLYVAEFDGTASQGTSRIQKWDARGTWSVIATYGQVDSPSALATDGAGDLYVADYGNGTQKRDAQGNWSLIATYGSDLGFVADPTALAVDTAGNLYVAEGGAGNQRIQKRDAQGNWSVIATQGSALGQVLWPQALVVDGAGNLYVADTGNNRVLKYTPAL